MVESRKSDVLSLAVFVVFPPGLFPPVGIVSLYYSTRKGVEKGGLCGSHKRHFISAAVIMQCGCVSLCEGKDFLRQFPFPENSLRDEGG